MLSDIISTIFPQRKYIPPNGYGQSPVDNGDDTPGTFYPGMNPNQRLGPGGENPTGTVPQVGFPQAMDEKLPGGQTVDQAVQGGFYPKAQPTTQPNSQPMSGQPMDVADAYEQAGGVPYDTPDFYPNAKGVKPATARQAAFEVKYDAENPEQKQQDLIQGKAPVDHSFVKRLVKGALRGFAVGGIGGAAVGATAQGFFPSANREANAAEELPKVNQQIAATNQNAQNKQQLALGQTKITDINEDNQRQRDALNQKTAMDKSRVDYWNRKADQGDLKLASNDELMQMRDKWMTSKNQNDQKRLAIAEKELGERQRHNLVGENQASTNEAGRNTRAKNSIGATDARAQRAIDARTAYAAYTDALAKGRMDQAEQYKEKLAKLKAEEDADKLGLQPE